MGETIIFVVLPASGYLNAIRKNISCKMKGE